MLPITIAGIGHYLPSRVVTSNELEAAFGLEPGWIERVTGIRERRYVNDETTVGMAVIAAQRAISAAGCSVGDIDLIIGASSAPQQVIPCTAAFVQRALGAPDGHSACFDVNATCISFLVALQQAAHLIGAGAYRTALIFSSEIGTRSRSTSEPESAVLFGDAAAAAIITRTPANAASAIWGSKMVTFSSGAELTQLVGGGTLHHPNDPRTTPDMNEFQMRGPAVFRMAARTLGPFLDSFFDDLGWDRRDIDLLVPHQASSHGVGLLTARLGFTPAQMYLNLAERGNCIAASIPLALSEALAQKRARRGDRLLLLGTGAGMSICAVGLTY
ncbi:MAG: ketoacyl-ACP synthase III [Oscillochloris sp.]|nr:ketoacyl-ACP synthase III [Oscillochloris sp.]